MKPSIRRIPAVFTKSATIAVVLSFIWPGLGQAYLGRRRRGALFAGPVVVLALILLWAARDGLEPLFARLFLVPDSSRQLVIATIVLALWRIASMTIALYDERTAVPPSGPRAARAGTYARPRRSTRIFAGLVVVVVLTHGLVAWTGLAFLDAASNVYVAGGPQSSAKPGSSGDPFGLLPTPYATSKPGGRINFLLIGADSGLGYDHALTDSMIVVSIDPTVKHVDMLSFPRDIAKFPLYSGGTYEGKLNGLASYAAAHADAYPDGAIGTLTREIGYLLGAPIHYYAFVDLAGFKAVIDAVGGIDVVNPRDISDPGYGFPDGTHGFFLSAGKHHLDGRLALAYVRSREGPGDNDFTRARRQQELLVALRGHLTDPTMVPKLASILKALASTVRTDVNADSVPDLVKLAKEIPESEVAHIVLGPPYAKRPTVSTGTYFLVIDEKKFAALSIRLFGAESRYASPSP